MTLNPNQRVVAFTHHPRTVYIDVTSRCNKACSVCPVRERTIPIGDMDFGFFRSVIDQLHRGTEVFLYQTGESLLHPEFFDMCAYAREKGMITHLSTNGLK